VTARRALANRLATVWMVGSLGIALVPLVLILEF